MLFNSHVINCIDNLFINYNRTLVTSFLHYTSLSMPCIEIAFTNVNVLTRWTRIWDAIVISNPKMLKCYTIHSKKTFKTSECD